MVDGATTWIELATDGRKNAYENSYGTQKHTPRSYIHVA